jgi:hypothetical protein
MSRTNDEGSASRPLRDKRGLVNRVHRLRGQVMRSSAHLPERRAAPTFCSG